MDTVYSKTSNNLTPQMIPLSEKSKSWKEKTMDRLETIGKEQLLENARLIENYELIKGRFIFRHYFDTEGYTDMINQLTKEFELPSYLRHYDIISQVVNVLSGEYQKRPDNFRVRGFDEGSQNEFLREKTRLLLEYVTSQIEVEINNRLLAEGIDQERTDFESEEEQQAFQQMVEERKQALTPVEIEEYMQQSWQSVAEQWGQSQIEADRQRFKLDEKEKTEFEDMLTSDRCFRHFYLTGDSYEQETWNPVNVFFHKSPEVRDAEDGDYVGRILYLTPSSIVRRYGWKMTKSQIRSLEEHSVDNKGPEGYDNYGIKYGSVIPFYNYPEFKQARDIYGFDPTKINQLDDSFFSTINSPGYTNFSGAGYFQVTEAYWQSFQKIGKLVYTDDEGLLHKEMVDERFIVPDFIKQINGTIYDVDQPNTITWTYVPQVWQGVKINPQIKDVDPIYLSVEPLPFQFKSDQSLYKNKLPVCGGIFNNRNGESMSLVDLMKPHQIGHNVAMNQLYQIMEREIGRFAVLNSNLLPNLKDHGGDRALEKFTLVARSLGVSPLDGSPENLNSGAISGNAVQVIDLDESARMLSRANIADFFEMKALKQVGFNQERLGNVAATQTATGTQQAISQSFASTESYFTNFSNYKRRCLTMNLDIAQYVQSQKDEIIVSYTKSDMSRAFIKLLGTDLLLREMSVYVSSSQEDLRQLEALKQLAMTNNTSDATMLDLATIIMNNSPKTIIAHLKAQTQRLQANQQQANQLEQQKLEQQQAQFEQQVANENEQRELDRQNKIELAYINSFGKQDDNLKDTDASGEPDILEYQKFNRDSELAQTQQQRESEKLNFEKEKYASELREREKDRDLKNRELIQKRKTDEAKLKVAAKNKNKYDK